MTYQAHLATLKKTKPIALYSSAQVYAMEQAWFAEGYDSFGLMKQAAWQMTQKIEQLYEADVSTTHPSNTSVYRRTTRLRQASIWVGKGNNGGDGWLIAYYLQQAGWKVEVITVGFDKNDFITDTQSVISNNEDHNNSNITDATKALQIAISASCNYQRFEEMDNSDSHLEGKPFAADGLYDVCIDALFGIGLDRAPEGIYKEAIKDFNYTTKQHKALAVAVDIPSGLVASTGEVFDRIAIEADVTLCLIARKFGLHTKDGVDYSGEVIDIPLIPYQTVPHNANPSSVMKVGDVKVHEPVAMLLKAVHSLRPRRQNSYKGSYGHVLIIGGNRVDGSQGMGGAAILSASSTMAAGAGKITVACHEAFHGALLTSLPDAMTINLHDSDGVRTLIKQASVVAIGMGLGRDKKAKALFIDYIQAAITHETSIVIDADGLYHLASLQMDNHKLVKTLYQYSMNHIVCLTPHSGEAARLLNQSISEIESNRLQSIRQCAAVYGGNWVLKGAGSLVLEQAVSQEQVYVCSAGNAGMATAGMGDVLSGVTAGLLAQQDLDPVSHRLYEAVLVHGTAGDILVNQEGNGDHIENRWLIGQRGLQAQDMPAAIRHVMQLMVD